MHNPLVPRQIQFKLKNMNFKTSELAKIELFAPGTAGERALRLEKKTGEVIIVDETQAATLIILPPPPDNQVLFSVSKQAEDYDAVAEISYVRNGHWNEEDIVAESMEEAIRRVLNFLRNENLPYPRREELDILHSFPDYYTTYWDSTEFAF